MLLTAESLRSFQDRATELNRSRRSRSSLHTLHLPNQEGKQEPETITIGLADSDDQRNLATMLVNRMYSWRGYGSNHRLSSAAHSVTFAASSSDEVIGTLTLTVDSPSGLALDKTFKEEMDSFRSKPGAKLCELTKFAFDASGPSKQILAALFHIIFIYGSRRYNCTDLFIEVNPRHCRFYEAMLGFQRVGSLKTNMAVDAPAQLMWLKVSDIRLYIDKHVNDGCKNGRSLYPYFFSPEEERDIYSRLASAMIDDTYSDCSEALPGDGGTYLLAARHRGVAAAHTYAVV